MIISLTSQALSLSMAALPLSLSHSLHTTHSFHLNKPTKTSSSFSVVCRSQRNGYKGGREEEEEKKKKKPWWRAVIEVGRGMKESLSPEHKGDWKDLMLMSFSFAVYVYISQRIVCTYCAWISMLKHSF